MKTVNKTYNVRRQNGLCAACGSVPADSFRCDSCKSKNNARSRATRNRHKENMVCWQCGENSAVLPRGKCAGCNGKSNRAAQRKRINQVWTESRADSVRHSITTDQVRNRTKIVTPRVLTLRLKGKWWDQIASGEKTVELRLATDYWRKRLIGRSYDEIHIWKGYPPRTDLSKLLRRKWQMVAKETIVHEEFGPSPVEVFCISVGSSV